MGCVGWVDPLVGIDWDARIGSAERTAGCETETREECTSLYSAVLYGESHFVRLCFESHDESHDESLSVSRHAYMHVGWVPMGISC